MFDDDSKRNEYLRKKREEILKNGGGKFFATSFKEKFREKLNEEFFNSFKKEKIEYETVSLRIDSRLKRWVEDLAKQLDTSMSKVVERALWILKDIKDLKDLDRDETSNT